MFPTIILLFFVCAGIGAAMSIAADRKMKRGERGDEEREVALIVDGLAMSDATNDDEVSAAAHAFRAPLAEEKWYLDLLMDQSAGKLNAKQKEYLIRAQENNTRLTTIANNLLNISRVTNGTMIVCPETGDIVARTREIVDAHATCMEEYACTARITARPAAIFLNIDTDLYSEILGHLLMNAMQYNENKNPIITITIKKEPSHITVSVTDNGKGMATKESAHIFKKFSRTRKGIKRVPEGSGLGLHVAHTIAAKLGGSLTYANTTKKGSTFTLALPAEGVAPHKGTRPLAR